MGWRKPTRAGRAGAAQLSAAMLVAVIACGAGCAAASRPAGEWTKTRESAEDLDAAREACKQAAMAEVAAATNQAVAAPAGAGSFFKCMGKKGWVQAAKTTPTPGQ